MVFSSVRPLAGGDLVEAVVRAVQLVELGGPHREQRAALEHLDLHAHLEHVGRRGHGDVGLLRLGQHPPDRVGRRRLDARLVDRAGHQVGRPHRQRRGRRPRRRDAAGRADAERPIVAMPLRHACRAGSASSATDDRRLVVGVPAGIGLGRDVVGHRNSRRPLRLLGRDLAAWRPARGGFAAGGGAMNLEATSTRETLAMMRLAATTRPESSRRSPATR